MEGKSMDERERRQFDKEYGLRLRITRAALGITEEQAADAFGITLKTYRRHEAGERVRGTIPILMFSERYNVSLDWLLMGDTSRLDRRFTTGNVAILRTRVAVAPRTNGGAV
jgi:transcriptional regulator with XRE-family HTH domain